MDKLRFVTSIIVLLIYIDNTRAEDRVKVAIYQDPSIDMYFFNSNTVKKIRGKDYSFLLRSFIISEDQDEVRYIDMIDSNVDYCKKNKDWLCVMGHMYRFALPLDMVKNEWIRGNTKFILLGKTFLKFMGKKTEVYAIYSEEQLPEVTTESEKFPKMTLKRIHYYSEKYGLIAFGRICSESLEASIVYSRYECGYGGLMKYCKESEEHRKQERKANIERAKNKHSRLK